MCKLSGFVITYSLSAILLVKAATTNVKINDVIGFPEKEENPALVNKENRQPVYSPSICPVNELFYPGDQKDDWICDCMPGYIYQPKSDQCWPAYRQGPCGAGEYLILPQSTFIPACEKNPCQRDGYVLLDGKCQRIGSTKPCEDLFPIVATVGVNATNLRVSCVVLNLDLRFQSQEDNTTCLPGCRRLVVKAIHNNST